MFPLLLLSVLTAENLQDLEQDFKVDPLPLVNYKISTPLPWSVLLASRNCADGNHTPNSHCSLSGKSPLVWRTSLLCPPSCFSLEWINSIPFIFPLKLFFPCLCHVFHRTRYPEIGWINQNVIDVKLIYPIQSSILYGKNSFKVLFSFTLRIFKLKKYRIFLSIHYY